MWHFALKESPISPQMSALGSSHPTQGLWAPMPGLQGAQGKGVHTGDACGEQNLPRNWGASGPAVPCSSKLIQSFAGMSAGLWRRLGDLPAQLWVHIPALTSACSVTLGRSHHLPEPQPDRDTYHWQGCPRARPSRLHAMGSSQGPPPRGSCIHVLISQKLRLHESCPGPTTGKV